MAKLGHCFKMGSDVNRRIKEVGEEDLIQCAISLFHILHSQSFFLNFNFLNNLFCTLTSEDLLDLYN